ncbi:hypothetical protein A8926_3684 [Saccharopolyspora spinosa]|uniref:Uncharacterized protein n=1 Tax=Saccharopolyspora spinosa TaxID=60894 RepID=A0A2N3XZ26_SACSN|nr:hypothetical protein A8926_3684 [Saccharopolyspora spinosa]
MTVLGLLGFTAGTLLTGPVVFLRWTPDCFKTATRTRRPTRRLARSGPAGPVCVGDEKGTGPALTPWMVA